MLHRSSLIKMLADVLLYVALLHDGTRKLRPHLRSTANNRNQRYVNNMSVHERLKENWDIKIINVNRHFNERRTVKFAVMSNV